MAFRVLALSAISEYPLLKYTRVCSRHIVTFQEIMTFQDEGAVCLRGVFKEWVEKLKKGIAKNHRNPSELSSWLRSDVSETFYFNDYFNWRKIPEFEEYVFESRAAEIAGKLMKSKFTVFYHEHVFTKDPGTNRATPWHHDQAYYPVDGWKNCSFWLPVTPVTKESCMKFVSGSHKWGKWFIPINFGSLENYSRVSEMDSDRAFENAPEIDTESENYDLLSWDLEPGDCIAFHMRVLHGAKQSIDTAGRQVVATRWLGEDATLGTRPWVTSPPHTGGLKPGDFFYTSDTFPVVWRSKQ